MKQDFHLERRDDYMRLEYNEEQEKEFRITEIEALVTYLEEPLW